MTLGVSGARPRSGRVRRRLAVAVSLVSLALLVLALPGCARFDDSASSPFSPEPTFSGSDRTSPKPPRPTRPPRTPGPCVDPDESVVATCLDTTGGLVVLPDGVTALVAERRTGRIMKVIALEQKTLEVARVEVDGSFDGGLLDLALSPTYTEDGIIFAYISTPYDNRVVRLTSNGDPPKDVLTGIPKGERGNNGALDFVSPTELLVLTGDAGDPAAANDPNSLAGKLLRIDNPSVGPPGSQPPPQVVMSGIGAAGDLCPQGGGVVWVTDRTPTEDRLQKITDGVPAPAPAWTWADRPGVAGCAAGGGRVAVMLTFGRAAAILTVDESGAITTAPNLVAQDQYGQLGGAAIGPDGTAWAATVNKTGGQPGPNDDRVVIIPFGGPGGGEGPD
ncbi:sorbosone dehydrogenase family protein [Antrihabitans sp. YC2-6]|uniref:PQQ-dependent sugar dehydrogenase n=1 Tax=Antrihabitans sp. YC2-6 TaxID=2799498 RepID=UPI0018F7294A|nr:PQQ-dependent sugar dehydrogenase [Antrihabitans sp. YC2-6]MBJ8343425.1 PQQ-dependent sugar dehydrogenase [Antrihabitans sp. YC2-6]